MVDLHNHLLPGLDDGAKETAMAVEMARIAADDGITHMVCTPHASARFSFQPEAVATKIEALRSALAAASIPLELSTGCDFHLNYENLQDALAHPRKYTINGGEYLLVELPDQSLPSTLEQTLYDLRMAGMTPILTHPERHPLLLQNPKPLAGWLRSGLLLQVTASSVTGRFGKHAQQLAQKLLRDRWVHFLASDAHDPVRRPPGMQEARDWVAEHCDPRYADLLVNGNPAAVVAGKALPAQPEPKGLYDDESVGQDPWWRKILDRLR